MTPAAFIKEAESHIYKEVAKYTNVLLGKKKTAALSTGLFLRLPIVVSVEKSDSPMPGLNKELKSFLPYFSGYTKMESDAKVYMTFLYHTERDLANIMKHLPRRNIMFAFVYLHEVQHVLRKHTTSSYEKLMTRIAGNIMSPHEVINFAEDYAINYSLKDLFMEKDSKLKAAWPELEEAFLYKRKYHDEQMSDIDILKDLVKSAKPITKKQLSDMLSEVGYDGVTMTQPTDASNGEAEGRDGDKCDTAADDRDAALSDLSNALQDIITSNTKGTAAGELFEKLFDSIKVETGWFKKIKASFKRQVYYKTHDYTTSWANINNTFRHIYKAPKKQFIDDKIAIILSVDHSGSMGTEDLQKLLYLIESESTRISELTVLIHDTRVIKEFVITDDFDIANSKEFTQALATRYTSGGTSHRCVFEHIQAMKIPDPNKVIYMSFSDNMSDIEESFKDSPIMRRLTNYWICAGGGRSMKVPGTNIKMA